MLSFNKVSLSFLLILLGPLIWASEEKIISYDIDIYLTDTTRFSVVEKIVYDFGNQKKRGIYRDIPIRLKRKVDTGFGEIYGNYQLNLDGVNVVDDQGESYEYKLIHYWNTLRIRIGQEDKFISGTHSYHLSYSVDRAFNEFVDHDEFYWNTIGHQWSIPIENIRTTIHFTENQNPQEYTIKSFQGFYGQTQPAQSSLNDKEYTIEITALKAKEGLTTAISYPLGVIERASSLKKAYWFIRDNFLYIYFLLMPLVFFIFYFIRHKKHGSDPKTRALKVEYSPPKDLSPAELGTLIDDVADDEDVVATTLYLASLGYLTIEKIETDGILFLKKDDYIFRKTLKDDKELSNYHELFMSCLFDDKDEVKLSSLKNKFFRYITNLKSTLYKELVLKKFYKESPHKVRSRNIILGAFLIMLYVGIGLVVNKQIGMSSNYIVSAPMAIITFFIVFQFSKIMPRRTRRGTRKLEEVLGLREFIMRVERERLERMIGDDPTIFEKILPFAMVFGVADEWAHHFRGLAFSQPSWYIGVGNQRFNSQNFVHEIGQSTSSMVQTFKSAPRSSGSGGSSGVSGGGFSGGGFGGGGGGSW